jgi:hypothetical protein
LTSYNRNIIFSCAILLLFSCSNKLQTLPDGWTKISLNKKVYKNKLKFASSLTSVIDTNSIYKECCFVQELDSSFFGLNKEKIYKNYSYRTDDYKSYYRFYSDGFFNHFTMNKKESELKTTNFDPKLTGFRGVYYLDKNGVIKIDLFTQTGQLSAYRTSYSNLTQTIKVVGDSLFIKSRGIKNSYEIYVKRNTTNEIKQIKGW